MRNIVVVVLVALVVAMSSSRDAAADIGSCYSVRPICMPGQAALCMCDQTYNCFWVCK